MGCEPGELMLRGEFRYDQAKCKNNANCMGGNGNNRFADPAGNFRYKDQFLFLVDMTYEFYT